MGDRGQVELISSDGTLFLYTHWGASTLPQVVSDALARGRGRWGDDEYLNRIIFSEMIQDCVLDETGFGIGLGLHGDVWRVVVVNHTDQTVLIKEPNYDKVDWKNFSDEDVVWEVVQEAVSFDVFIELSKEA